MENPERLNFTEFWDASAFEKFDLDIEHLNRTLSQRKNSQMVETVGAMD